LALAWAGFFTCFVVAVVYSAFRNHGQGLGSLPFALGFWAIGWVLVAVALQLGRRTVELVVEGGQLRVTFKGPIRTTQKIWSRPELAAIRVDRSNVEINHRVLPELQIHPRSGKKQGMLAGHEEKELLWLATRLRQALQVPAA